VFLLDTNIVSEVVKRTPDAKVTARLNREDPKNLYISTIVVFELRFGAARSAKPAALWSRIERDIICKFQVLPFSDSDALAAADLMSTASGAGRNLAVQDLLLAGAAFSRGFTFVTRNRRDFDPIVGLRIENWFD
jgi:tRNA(fMet)-specific endonuclease VapC